MGIGRCGNATHWEDCSCLKNLAIDEFRGHRNAIRNIKTSFEPNCCASYVCLFSMLMSDFARSKNKMVDFATLSLLYAYFLAGSLFLTTISVKIK